MTDFSIQASYFAASQDYLDVSTGQQGQPEFDDRRSGIINSDDKKRRWAQVETESQWSGERRAREPKTWWDATCSLMVRNAPAFCEFACCAAILAVGIARCIPFSSGTELMVAAVTRYSAITVIQMLQLVKRVARHCIYQCA